MIEHAWNMKDALGRGCVGASEREIVILAAFEALPKSADLLHKRTPIYAEMAYHVMAEQKIDIPVGFEIRRKPPPAAVDLVFVAVDNIEVRIIIERNGNLIKRVFGQEVVMIHQRDELACC